MLLVLKFNFLPRSRTIQTTNSLQVASSSVAAGVAVAVALVVFLPIWHSCSSSTGQLVVVAVAENHDGNKTA